MRTFTISGRISSGSIPALSKPRPPQAHEAIEGAPIGDGMSVVARSRKDTFGMSRSMDGPNRSLLDRRESGSGRVEIV